eukprot:gnl/Spiro4/9590_TR5086_c0_g1_i1.p1 gnl/Spiro4/9590_TR5086_c0_g1~~gnl/Spiro4/9590_TR5086_c0_g1_i1.p1  ORF type:complete len:307 (+),score=40.60 gnl/Spiro4/9590_TR5086_c0_g1_i1:81-1001(+)
MGCTDTKGATDSTTSSATGDKPKPQPPTYTPVVVPAFNSVAVACPPAPALTTSSTSTSSAPPIAPAPKSVSIPSQPSRPVPQSAAHVLPRTSGATPARAPVYQRLENLPHLSNSSLSAISTAAREAAAAMSATLAAVDTPTAVLARYGAVTVFRNNQGTEKTGTRILADGVVQLFQDMGFDLLGEKDPSLLVLFIMFRLNVGRAARWIKLEPFQALLARYNCKCVADFIKECALDKTVGRDLVSTLNSSQDFQQFHEFVFFPPSYFYQTGKASAHFRCRAFPTSICRTVSTWHSFHRVFAGGRVAG